jgi:hypothetical protein
MDNHVSDTVPAFTVPQLLKMSQKELDDLFTNSPAGDIPDGDSQGTVIVSPGTVTTAIKAKLMHVFGWQGKIFDAKHGTLVNKVLMTGTHAIAAQVYKDRSWYDNKECIVVDYSKTSLVARWARDEIRFIAPRTYLGVVYMGKKKTIDFVLVFPESEAGTH